MSGYVDADGHVIENAVEIFQYLEPPFDKMRTPLNILPDGDKFHSPSVQSANPAPGAFETCRRGEVDVVHGPHRH